MSTNKLTDHVTQKQFGEIVGISQAAVSDLLQRGVIEKDQPLCTWLLSYCMNLRLQASRWSGDLSAERTRLTAAKAALAELTTRERAGELVKKSEVQKTAFDLARSARDALLTIPDRLASVVAAERDTAIVHKLINDEVRHVCQQLASASRDALK